MSKRAFYVTSGYPKGVSRPALKKIVDDFLSKGMSTHTASMTTGSLLINELVERNIPFCLIWSPDGAVITKGKRVDTEKPSSH